MPQRGDVSESDVATIPGREAPAGPMIGAAFVGGWALALPLPPPDIAKAWTGLARRLLTEEQPQAIALLRAVQAMHSTPESDRMLGFALIEMGEGREALELLEPIAADFNLSSRETRLLALAREGHDGTDLRARCARAVRSRLRVAAIMDEFTATGFGPDCDLQQLSVEGWAAELEAFRPQILLIESAWRGLRDEWGSKVGQCSQEIRDILDWCRARDVPTAFWNKEDPVHFDTFMATARRFDAVFTTDIDCIPRYKARLGHDRVYLLPFACQPEIHNPIEIGTRTDAFCFAGAYYVRYPDRIHDLNDFLDHLPQYRPFEIFDRNFGKDHPDYMFPEGYRQYIVGTLSPAEIDRAYKGYTFGINMNSVKNSQSMFARRVYELLASNTRIVSNYSVGVRLLFGDLIVSTDSGEEALRRIRRQDEAGWTDRIRLAGLRKALTEHTYSHRLAYLARTLGCDIPDGDALPSVTVLALARTWQDRERLLKQFARQSLAGARMVLVAADGLDAPDGALPQGVRLIGMAEAARTCLRDLVAPGEWLAGFVSADHYGANYLLDLALATRFSTAAAFGKAAYHRVSAAGIERVDGPVYRPTQELALRRALLRHDILPPVRLDTWLLALPEATIAEDAMLALDPFNYCEEGAAEERSSAETAAAVDDLPGLSTGLPVDELLARAEAAAPAINRQITAPFLPAAGLPIQIRPSVAPRLEWHAEEGRLSVTSRLGTEERVTLYEKEARPLPELMSADGLRLHGWAGPGLNTAFAVSFHDAAMETLGQRILTSNRNYLLEPPEGTAFVRFGLRFRGPGSGAVHGVILGKHYPPPVDVISKSPVLLLTNHYASYQDLYRNSFIHSRMKAYRELGDVTPDVFRLHNVQETSWHEFQDITCITGSAAQLDFMLASGQYRHVLVHFLNESMWDVLARHIDRVRVTIWVHGVEVQPWWRRKFNYVTDAEIRKAMESSDRRLALWRSLFDPLPENLRFVFVSQRFANDAFEDLGVSCPPEHYRIIHNPIDDALFARHEKPVEQRGRILSIRPFASPTYANDLTVKAILALQDEDFFKDLEFRIVGDGVLFDEITAPLAGLPNVICEKRFLTHAEIAALHRDYGVFLCPSRMDSQGVSRDEAMSSGLVPVTTRVAAIPEFVDETCGYLAEPEDAEGLARAIAELWRNPGIFLAKSQAAAERVRRQSSKAKMIGAELALFSADLSQDGG